MGGRPALDNHIIKTDPDPTEAVKEALTLAIKNADEKFALRLEAMDRAVLLLQETQNRSPTIGEVYAKFNEKFKAIDQQFIERDKRTDQLTLASSTAIAAALQAQKEAAGEAQKSSAAAIAKAETATSESIKQLQALFQTSIGGLTTQILDLKSRLDKGEGGESRHSVDVADVRHARWDLREEKAEGRGVVFGIIGITISLAAVIVAIFGHFMK
jgi:hypothetical protein